MAWHGEVVGGRRRRAREAAVLRLSVRRRRHELVRGPWADFRERDGPGREREERERGLRHFKGFISSFVFFFFQKFFRIGEDEKKN